jgi:hypothetical protein
LAPTLFLKTYLRGRFLKSELYCHATEKSEAIATRKEMPVIPGNKVVDKKRILG